MQAPFESIARGFYFSRKLPFIFENDYGLERLCAVLIRLQFRTRKNPVDL